MCLGRWHRHHRHDIRLNIQERAQGELAGLAGALAVGEGAAGREHIQSQLQHVVLADAAHLSLGQRHLVELLGRLQVLTCDAHLLDGHQEVEEMVDGLHRHLLCLGEEARLCLAVAKGFQPPAPLHVVHAEERLRERYGYGQRHKLVAPAHARLMKEIE